MGQEQNHNLKIALIGFGFVGRVFHANMIDQTEGLELSAVVTHNKRATAQVHQLYPRARVYDNNDDFFKDIDRYDAVSIGTPDDTHLEFATRVMQAGKPVVIDKPVAGSSQEANKILDVAQATGTPAAAFQNRRHDAEILTASKYLKELDLGRIIRVESRYGSFRPNVETGWREQKTHDQPRGALFDLGAHTLDQVVQLFGPVTSIYGEVSTQRENAVVPDDFFIAATHQQGIISHIVGGLVQSTRQPRLTIQGTLGSLQINVQDPEEDQLKAGMRIDDPHFGVMSDPTACYIDREGEEHILPAVRGWQPAFYEGWRDFLRGKADNPVPLAESVHVLELLDQAMLSSQDRRIIQE